MKTDTRAEIETAIQQTSKATEQLDKTDDFSIDQAEQIAKRYAKESSSTLVGIVGAIIGGAGGVAITAAVGTTMILTGPLGAALGGAFAILAWRGNRRWHLERETEKAELELEVIRKQLAALPQDAPDHVRKKWWDMYHSVQSKLERVALQAFDSGDEATLKLPPGDDHPPNLPP